MTKTKFNVGFETIDNLGLSVGDIVYFSVVNGVDTFSAQDTGNCNEYEIVSRISSDDDCLSNFSTFDTFVLEETYTEIDEYGGVGFEPEI